MNPHIVFTGGGTAGHVTPNLALIDVLQDNGWQIDYIGSENGVEKDMICSLAIPYHAVSSGKLRRYFSWQNFIDPFRILLGIGQAYCLLKKIKPDLVFSKGGFVAFPVVVAAWLQRIPAIAHESDLTPGLANRLTFPFVSKICLTFAAAKKHFKNQDKVEITGTPIRAELFKGSKDKGLELCGFNADKPCLLVMGGSQGSASLNEAVRRCLPVLCEQYQVVHLCGKGKIDKTLLNRVNYFQMEYAKDELADLLAASDLIVSRAGANALYEILALEKPHVLLPLSGKVSRGDQLQNARYFKEQGISTVIEEEQLCENSLMSAIHEVQENAQEIRKKIRALEIESATAKIIALIKEEMHVQSPEVV
ncbi:undecaprenyldiphospho-muramoylpentapeptide beta-N-acetylglucosaminyltransferase [Legionella jordanis]|uniref:UDP-N-acetylglucosamine--N-acetylmuramyl-(pentapeptide) pyrophosphoryl-undecaprenol N-acetylglucosamine transferase n=1 Tax=Legionella jordanis TaxID=456 RepID=A0A0W0VFQ5_9GAMM|nr:undecaprenyldiphospho-muramoylpentapeptide beta-N-acetylglucosaminyltransferase [Legionella jordanis]KTD18922.1 undecaprenyldiphospho-muramoylpentapeptide beta-N- acetylglucosaminyltransferase [Legionella jordanis]RMX05514.1 undecaprenyldiphospho-muramoylpentapeptide beta-N-acetylglucosaminyltransferase [Legionella jordanis]RMX19199.1 undecaprenyldiphospho-muramoylpentapeptide beta-N-acetylglucosaminyltransferase [Legionella jordanis]VEH13022.1 UDP-N-acetylglucosamine-N-acetylmuramyl-(pentap